MPKKKNPRTRTKKPKTKQTTTAAVDAMLNKIIAEALIRKASSIHLEKHEDQAKLRYRINNELKSGGKLTSSSFDKLSQHLKSLANVSNEIITPHEGRFKIKSNQEQINISTAFWPTYQGEKIVLKILNAKNNNLQNLILNKEDLENLGQALTGKSGLILLTEMRPTNKNRLLYALLNQLDKDALDIFTLEDFIEYPLLGVHQQQLATFNDEYVSEHLAKLMRHEPDVVMISKISGPESAKQIINSAGHNIVLTYLPAGTLQESMLFLKNWGIDDYVLESVLKHIVTHQDNKYKII